jgi:hypothetical protein
MRSSSPMTTRVGAEIRPRSSTGMCGSRCSISVNLPKKRSAERRPALRQSAARTRWRVRCPPGGLSGLVWC